VGGLAFPGAQSVLTCKIAPLYVLTTNEMDPLLLFEDLKPSERGDVLVIDTTSPDETELAERARLSAWLNDLQEDPRRATVRRSDLCLQLASLVAWWLADEQRGEREMAAEMMLANTLVQHTAKRVAQVRAEIREAAGPSGDGDGTVVVLQTWLHAGHIVHSPGNFLKRGDIYKAAGCEIFSKGGTGARDAFHAVDDWVLETFDRKPVSRRNQWGYPDLAVF
jgi:hypothetical protein